MTDRLAYIDQATFLSMQANDYRSQLVQYVWVYTHPVDEERLRRFHRNVGFGFAGRLIEPSILPFGRHRWVAATGPAAPLDVDDARPPGSWGPGSTNGPSGASTRSTGRGGISGCCR